MATLTINGKRQQINADPNMPLLWAIRDILGLTGTKYGCGVAQCGACVVHLNGDAVRSCVTKLSRADGQEIVAKSSKFRESRPGRLVSTRFGQWWTAGGM